tara:strand:+ start:17974 stop:18312 length:339 start_codon:yes stop_codon:yes gene_type:complete
MKKTRISFEVELDKNNVPEKIVWTAPDGGVSNEKSKAVFLSVWDDKKQETLKIDLWTKDMPLDHMNVFFHQTLVSMNETFLRATQNQKMSDSFKQFCEYFAENLKLQSPRKL